MLAFLAILLWALFLLSLLPALNALLLKGLEPKSMQENLPLLDQLVFYSI